MKNYQKIISIISNELQQVDEQLCTMIVREKNFLTDKFLEFVSRKSKKIRPAVSILILKSIFGKITPKQIKICALTELLHNASLIHDDIIDNADLRRGVASFNKIFGDKTAVLAGDYLLAAALRELLELDNAKITQLFVNALFRICNGEIEQISEKNKIISIEKYIEKSEKKTAELFKINLMSVFLAENQTEYLSFAENFGEKFGIAFQIYDDLMNFLGNDKNKPLGNDILKGIYTAPAIYYFDNNPFEKPGLKLIKKIKKSSAVSQTQDLCAKFANGALDLTEHFIDNQYKQALTGLCNLLKKGTNNEF